MLRLLARLLGLRKTTGSGDRGEQLAAEWLRREKRVAIIARNWRSPKDRRDEIDLVCRDQETLVFVEVKARAANALVPGYYAVDRRKKKILRRGVGAYLGQLKSKPATFRFDVIEVSFSELESTPPVILHFENVPLFSKSFRP